MACEARTGAGVSLKDPRNFGGRVRSGYIEGGLVMRRYLCSSSPGCSDDIHIFKLGSGGCGEVPEVFEELKTSWKDS